MEHQILNGMLHSALALFGLPVLDVPEEPVVASPAESLEAAHAQLGAAQSAAATAERAHQEAQAATARVLEVIRAVEPAEEEAKAAAAAAAEGTRRWAEQGASPDLATGDQVLLDRAADAERRAAQARIRAAGAELALPRVREAEDLARWAAEAAVDRVKVARTAVRVAEDEPLLLELEQIRARYAELLPEAAALALFLDPKWAGAHHWRRHTAGDSNFRLRVAALAIPLPDERELRARAEELAAEIAQQVTSGD